MAIQLNPEEMFDVFGEFDPIEHEAEVQERWGDTDALRESRRRTSSYTKEDWVRIKADQEEVETGLLRAMQAGLGPTSSAAMDAAEAHRANISRWFYDCDYAIHRGLADMYVADPRFSANYENRAAGLAAFVHDAIHANADRAAPD
jgi:MerR family transcriptional regulator, thiopeptide resistance regulator